MNQSEFFESEIYGVHWGLIPMPAIPMDVPDINYLKFERLLFPDFIVTEDVLI